MPRPGGTRGRNPDLGPHGLLDGRLMLPSHLPRQAASLGRTDCPVPQIPHALQGRTSLMEEDHRTTSEGNDHWRVSGRGVGDDETPQMQKWVLRQDLLQAGVGQGWCSCHLVRERSRITFKLDLLSSPERFQDRRHERGWYGGLCILWRGEEEQKEQQPNVGAVGCLGLEMGCSAPGKSTAWSDRGREPPGDKPASLWPE